MASAQKPTAILAYDGGERRDGGTDNAAARKPPRPAAQRDQRAVSEYEHGKRRIAATDLPRWADALDVPLMCFFEGDLDSDDLDRMLLIEFKRWSSSAIKRDAIELLRVFSGAIERVEGRIKSSD